MMSAKAEPTGLRKTISIQEAPLKALRINDGVKATLQRIAAADAAGTTSVGDDAQYREQARLIKGYVGPHIGKGRQVCGGVITSNYLDISQMASNNIILTYEDGERRTTAAREKHGSLKRGAEPELLSFAVCRIEAMGGQFDPSLGYERAAPNVNKYTLYVDVICSRNREGSNWLWGQINTIAISLGISVKLSSLSYVAAYYKRKKNFNFYTMTDGGLVPDATLNSMLENPKWPFFSEDARHEAPDAVHANWLQYLNAKLDPESEGFQEKRNAKELSELRTALDELIAQANRRDTLRDRLTVVNRIMSILNTEDDEAGFQMVSEFFQTAIESGVAVGANIHVLTRATGGLTGKERAQKMLAAHDIGDNGFTMFNIPAQPERLGQSKAKGAKKAADEHKGGGRKRRRKRTRKRALRKRHRRTRHKKKRRKTRKRKRRRRRRTRR